MPWKQWENFGVLQVSVVNTDQWLGPLMILVWVVIWVSFVFDLYLWFGSMFVFDLCFFFLFFWFCLCCCDMGLCLISICDLGLCLCLISVSFFLFLVLFVLWYGSMFDLYLWSGSMFVFDLFFFSFFLVLLWSGFELLVVGFDLGRKRRTICNVLMKNYNDK